MRNLDEEIKVIEEKIKALEVTKNQKKTQLKKIKREQREEHIVEVSPYAIVDDTPRDLYGKPILVGDWVNVKRKGRFNGTEGTVVKIQKWVTFEDTEGFKQSRAPHNLIVSNLPASDHVRKLEDRGNSRGK